MLADRNGAIVRRLRQMIKCTALATLPRRLLLAQGPRSSPFVYLTYDDGPHPENTPKLLDVLRTHGVPATFFVVGELAEKHPDIVSRIAREGHDLGNHTFHHTRTIDVSLKDWLQEVHRTSTLLKAITDRQTRLVRPPYGRLGVRALLSLWRMRYTVVLWNVSHEDFRAASSDQLIDRIEQHSWQAGDVVLLHDWVPSSDRASEAIIRCVRRRGLGFGKASFAIFRGDADRGAKFHGVNHDHP